MECVLEPGRKSGTALPLSPSLSPSLAAEGEWGFKVK